MAEYTMTCPSCEEARSLVDALVIALLPQGVNLDQLIGEEDGEEVVELVDHRHLSIRCRDCDDTGVLLTPLGKHLAAAIGRHMRGAVIV